MLFLAVPGMAESLRKPFRYYVDFFDEAAELIRRKVILKDDKIYHPAITCKSNTSSGADYASVQNIMYA